jgi:hypothetical protein
MQAIHATRPGGHVGFVGVAHGVAVDEWTSSGVLRTSTEARPPCAASCPSSSTSSGTARSTWARSSISTCRSTRPRPPTGPWISATRSRSSCARNADRQRAGSRRRAVAVVSALSQDGRCSSSSRIPLREPLPARPRQRGRPPALDAAAVPHGILERDTGGGSRGPRMRRGHSSRDRRAAGADRSATRRQARPASASRQRPPPALSGSIEAGCVARREPRCAYRCRCHRTEAAPWPRACGSPSSRSRCRCSAG